MAAIAAAHPVALTESSMLKAKPSPAEAKKKGTHASASSGDKNLDRLYNIMTSFEKQLGGGEGIEGIYGSITQKGTQRIFSSLHHNCGMGHDSVLVDVGAGLGRPLVHALFCPGVRSSFGIELDEVKVVKANSFIRGTLLKMSQRFGLEPPQQLCGAAPSPPQMHCVRIEDFDTLEPATHAYSFWEGIPVDGRRALGKLFAKSRSLCGIAVVQRAMRGTEPAALMRELGFGPLLLISNFAVSMSGSGASFQAYVFAKVSPHGGIEKLLSPAPVRAPVRAAAAHAAHAFSQEEETGAAHSETADAEARAMADADAGAMARPNGDGAAAAAEASGRRAAVASVAAPLAPRVSPRKRSARLSAKSANAKAASSKAAVAAGAAAEEEVGAARQRTITEAPGFAPRRRALAGTGLKPAVDKPVAEVPRTRGTAASREVHGS